MKSPDEREIRGSMAAFSLIEVVLALGIVAVVLVPMIGALSQSMTSAGHSTDRVNQSRIIRHLAGLAQQSDWGESDELKSFHNVSWYFDDRANALELTDSPDRRVYVARLLVEGDGFMVPGASQPNPDMKQVTILVSSRPQLSDPFQSGESVMSSGILVTRQDR